MKALGEVDSAIALTLVRATHYTIVGRHETNRSSFQRQMLEHLFGSRTRLKLLRLFLTHPGEQFFVRELSRKIDERLNSVRRELANLERITLVESSAKNQKRFYRLNTQCVLYPELKALIIKARLAIEQGSLKKLKQTGAISLLILSGVFTGVDDAQTDILIVGRLNRRKLRSFIRQLQEHFESEIRYTIMSKKEYGYRIEITDRFLFTILDTQHVTLIDTLKHKKGSKA